MFSVIIPTHNRLDLLKRALSSLEKQTYKEFEVIVIDDGNTLNKHDKEEVLSFKLNIKILNNKESKGPSESRNLGVSNAKYEWVAFLDDDDEFVENKLDTIKKHITLKNPDLIHHDATIKMVHEKFNYKTKSFQSLNYQNDLFIKNIIGGTPVVVVKKEILKEAGGFSKDLEALEDYELWIKISKNTNNIIYLSEELTLCNYYTRKKSVSKNIENNKNALKKIYNKYEKEISNLNNSQRKKRKVWIYDMLAHKYLCLYQRASTLYYLKSFKTIPNVSKILVAIISLISPKMVFYFRSKL
ncbi:glycosyltransferase family A protein [Bacillus sp. Marseille-Q1617]|uniref:glycosyltransferase family 2 protein n=1 Tax=Bacillus sp. Marseille-Q1617 TaxID=2736887 RepID=UPI001589AEB5|nr:glycosyltransferase family A protein [Bacillus sp. Marseille-Q1617]